MKRLLVSLVIAVTCFAGGVFAATESGSDTNTPPHHRPGLTDEQKTQMGERADAEWNKLTPEAKAHLIRMHQALVEMPAEERQLIHQQIERFLKMTPAEREQVQKNAKTWNEMTPEQREKIRALYRQRRRELELTSPSTNPPPPAASGTLSTP